MVVGAITEDSSTTGVNSTPNDSASNSGAAYIFTGLGSSTAAPIVATPTSTQVTTTTATLGGNVTSDGGATITPASSRSDGFHVCAAPGSSRKVHSTRKPKLIGMERKI